MMPIIRVMAKPFTVSVPMPEAAPVTSAVLPARRVLGEAAAAK
jgi:hypothetical protein